MFDKSVHNKIKHKNRIFVLSVSFFVLAFTIARMFLTRLYIDPNIHFYTDTSNFLVRFFDYIVAACVVAIYVTSLFVYKRRKEKVKYIESVDCFVQGTQSQVFSASLTGFLFVASSIFQVYSFFNPAYSDAGQRRTPYVEKIVEYIKLYPFDFAIFFVSILSSVYFFKTAALNFDIGENIHESNGVSGNDAANKYSSAHIIFSFMPIIWSFLNIFKCFFDMSKSVNSPVRIYELLSFLALSAYFVSESRMLVGRLETSRFFTYAYLSVIIAATSALPNLIWSSFWIFSTNNVQIVYAVQIAVVVYIYSRVYSQIKYGRFFYLR